MNHCKRSASLACVAALACTLLAPHRGLAAPTIIARGISSIMTPSVIDWHNRILSVQIRSGVSSLVTCSGGQILDTLQPGQDLFQWTLSQYGLAYVQRPQNLYVHPAGAGSQFVYSAPASMGYLAMNDSGALCYASRDTVHTGLNTMWIRQPNQSPVQLAAPASGSLTVNNMAIDPIGNIYAGVSITGANSEIYRWSTQGWTNLTANWANSVSFLGMNHDGSQIVFSSSEPGYQGLYQLRGDSISQLGITYPNLASPTTKVADNGNVLVYWHSYAYFGVPAKAYMYRSDGSVVDLSTVVPAGESLSAAIDNGHVDMNHQGLILLEAASTVSGNTLYDYYRYDGTTCTDLLETNAAVLLPSMCDDGLMYYYYRESSGSNVTLTMAAVPEPKTLMLLLAAGAIGLLGYGWRRRVARTAKPSAFDQPDAPAILSSPHIV